MTSRGMTRRHSVELEHVFVEQHPESRSASNKTKFYAGLRSRSRRSRGFLEGRSRSRESESWVFEKAGVGVKIS